MKSSYFFIILIRIAYIRAVARARRRKSRKENTKNERLVTTKYERNPQRMRARRYEIMKIVLLAIAIEKLISRSCAPKRL